MALDYDDLSQFTGSLHWFQHWLSQDFLYTDGVQFLAENGKAYWLIDTIFSHQFEDRVRQEPFQLWILTVDLEAHNAILVCEDGNGHEVTRQDIPYTDFPLPEIVLYLENNVLLLPSEH